MRLNVPTNFDPRLIEAIAGFPVDAVYGKMQRDIIGGGRPSNALPEVSRDEVSEHIRLVHQKGFKFNYLLNSSCIGNFASSADFDPAFRRYMDWIVEIGADWVTVSIPYLIEIILRHYPSLKVSVSVFSHVDSVDQALFYESFGVHEITIVQLYNRDFAFLEKFRKHLSTDMQIIANNACLLGCPYRRYHANINSHSTQEEGRECIGFDYPTVSCTQKRLKYPQEFIKSPWIRPEDTDYYQTMGIDKFKISGRTKSTPWLIDTIGAYAKKSSPANFADLLSIPDGPGSYRQKPYDGAEKAGVFIDSEKLGGFLKPFTRFDCRTTNCSSCGYCRKVAQRAVRIEEGEKAVDTYRKILDRHLHLDVSSR
jgi:collagenase-like PrtC family protease